jgi:predicted ribosome quality control (RQC) complex YloA/Tae2 family protein
MYKNYYYLNRLIIELKPILIGKQILNCFSQDKDKLIFQLNDDNLWLEISVNHNEPFISVRNKYARAKKNTIDFFEPLNGSNIIDVQIATDDRIVKVKTDKGDLFFAIRGKHTNIYLRSDNAINTFKSEEESILDETNIEFSNKNFTSNFNLIDFASIVGKDISEIRSVYTIIGRDIENEVKARRNSDSELSSISYDSEILKSVLKNVLINKPVVCIDNISNEMRIGFISFKIFSKLQQESFDDLISAFNHFLVKRYQLQDLQSKLKIVSLYIEKELKRLTNKLSNLHTVISSGSNEAEYNKFANLILINLNSIKGNNDEVELADIFDESDQKRLIKIKLDNKLSIKKNAVKYFEKARDSKLSYEKSKTLYSESKQKFEQLKVYQQKISLPITIDELKQIMKELKIKEKTDFVEDVNISNKFKHYLFENKYHVFVGKDSQNNDLLTTKFAKQNDFWFHARSVSGSHVVLRVDNTKEAVPKNILKKVASLAAYHSKAKTAGVVPVSYTLKKYVVKRKGMPIGQVSLLKEDVFLVKPEIPIDTEYLTQ